MPRKSLEQVAEEASAKTRNLIQHGNEVLDLLEDISQMSRHPDIDRVLAYREEARKLLSLIRKDN